MAEEATASWTADDWNTEGMRLMRLRDYPAAYEAFEKAVALCPDFLAARLNMEEVQYELDPSLQRPKLSSLRRAFRWTLKKLRPVSAGLFVIAILSFLLPWSSGQSRGAVNVVSGTDLLLGYVVTDTESVFSRDARWVVWEEHLQEVNPEPMAMVVLILAAVGAALSGLKGKWGCAVRGLAGWLSIILFGWILDSLFSYTPNVELGLTLAVMALGFAALLNALAFGRLQAVTAAVRKPWLPALLNIVPLLPGMGYLYVGRTARFAFAFVGFVLVSGAALVWIVAIAFSGCFGPCSWLERSYPIVMPILFLAFIAWDAWEIARKHNLEVAERTDG